jgi:tRNA (guanine37-N1)-methyltransferase
MKISIITLFPKMIEGFFNESIIKRAIDKKLVEIEIINLRDFATDKYKSVDDRPYGGGAGMILRADIVYAALNKIKNQRSKIKTTNQKSKIILTSPKGKQFNQQLAIDYSQLDHLIIFAGHYEGVDERVMDYIDEEISMGDFVMTGGEITASAITDAVVRLIPGVLKKSEAIKLESFFDVDLLRLIEVVGEKPLLKKLYKKGIKKVKLLEYPHYTRPEDFKGKKVPPVLLSGNHQDIENWRLKMAYSETFKKRKDLLDLMSLRTPTKSGEAIS